MLPLADSAINLSEFGYWQPHRTSNMLLHYLVMYRLFFDVNVSQGSVATYTRCGQPASERILKID